MASAMMKNPSGVQTSSFIIKMYKLISSLMQHKEWSIF